MSGKLTIEIDGDEAKAHAAFLALTKDQKALVAEIGKMGTTAEKATQQSIDASKREAKERSDQIRLANSLVKSNESLTQAYDRQKKALDTALDAGTITADEYKQTLEALDEKVRQNSSTAIEAARKQDEIARKEIANRNQQISLAQSIVKSSESISQSYDRQKNALDAAFKSGSITLDQYQQGLKKIQTEAESAFKKVGEMDQATEKGVGTMSLNKVESFAAKFLTIAAAVATVKKALEFYNAEKEKAIGSTESLVEARQSLRGLGAGTFDQLEKRSDKLTELGIDRIAARKLVFKAVNDGFVGDEGLVAAASSVIPVDTGAEIVGDFKRLFGNQLDAEAAMNLFLKGGQIAPARISLMDLSRQAMRGQPMGIEASDLIASLSVLSGDERVTEQAGRMIKTLGIELSKNEQTRGMSLIDAVEQMSIRPALREEIVGTNAQLMALIPAFIERLDEIKRADLALEREQFAPAEQSMIRRMMAEAVDEKTESGRIEKSRREAIAAQARTEAQNERLRAEAGFKSKTAIDTVTANTSEMKLPGRVVGSATAKTANFFGASDETIVNLGTNLGGASQNVFSGGFDDLMQSSIYMARLLGLEPSKEEKDRMFKELMERQLEEQRAGNRELKKISGRPETSVIGL